MKPDDKPPPTFEDRIALLEQLMAAVLEKLGGVVRAKTYATEDESAVYVTEDSLQAYVTENADRRLPL